MTYIGIDTNIWIYLTNDTLFELWEKLVDQVRKREISIFINDLIFLEWERNKSATIKSLTNSIKGEYYSAKKLSNYLPDGKRAQLLEIISHYQDESKNSKSGTTGRRS